MPAIDINWIVPDKIGVTNVQTIKNVQPEAILIVPQNELVYARLEFGTDLALYASFVDSIRTTFSDFFAGLDEKNLTKLVDSKVFEGFYEQAIDAVCEKTLTLLTEGSIFSDTLKNHLLEKYSEVGLTLDMFSKPKTTSAKTGGKAKVKIDLGQLDIDIDDL